MTGQLVCLPMVPNGPSMSRVAAGRSPTTAASGSAADGSEQGVSREQKELFEAIAKLSLHLKGERWAMARDDNYVFEVSRASEMAKALAWAEEAFRTVGDKWKKELDDFYGRHPQCEGVEAPPTSMIEKLVGAIKEEGGGSIEGYVQSKLAGLGQQDQEDALRVLYALDGRGRQPVEIRSKKCFKIETEEEGGETTEWIAEASRDKGLRAASGTTRKVGLISDIPATAA